MKKHGERAHSKFSASGAERWIMCSGSVELSEGLPDTTSDASLEGTLAHEFLEGELKGYLSGRMVSLKYPDPSMGMHVRSVAKFIAGEWRKRPSSDLRVESRVYLSHIHPEMFGTLDAAILDWFGTLHVYDFKYGKHMVSPEENLQMIFYALAMAHEFHWNFQRVRLCIAQPRVSGYDGPSYWEITIEQLRRYEKIFRDGVKKVETKPEFKEGEWCFFCKAKKICPLKRKNKEEAALAAFSNL